MTSMLKTAANFELAILKEDHAQREHTKLSQQHTSNADRCRDFRSSAHPRCLATVTCEVQMYSSQASG